jgi:hypothetical protein
MCSKIERSKSAINGAVLIIFLMKCMNKQATRLLGLFSISIFACEWEIWWSSCKIPLSTQPNEGPALLIAEGVN